MNRTPSAGLDLCENGPTDTRQQILALKHLPSCQNLLDEDDQEQSDTLDYQPGRILIRRLIRPTYVRDADRDDAPVTANLPPRLQDGLTATPALIAQNLVSKSADHLPFYRQ